MSLLHLPSVLDVDTQSSQSRGSTVSMRLLHTKEFRFEEFYGDDIPPYQILSHRWLSGEEVSYLEFIWLNREQWTGGQIVASIVIADDSKRQSSGYHKIMNFRANAARFYDWCWVDTVCIDKSSSAELSEAINSMYKWYERADWCTIYLADVTKELAWQDSEHGSFAQSLWFKRGWTLQELLAANRASFWDVNWCRLGEKATLGEQISKATGIPIPVLIDVRRNNTWFSAGPTPLSAADRMALMAGRQTTRKEDEAYSLMGLFEVNMPMLYGEDTKAFGRLQETIIQRQHDMSIFIHTGQNLLADGPSDFTIHNGAQYLKRRHEVASRSGASYIPTYIEKYVATYGNTTARLNTGTWARGVTSRGVEMQATYLEVNHTFKDWRPGEYRLLIIDYANVLEPPMPRFILVHKATRSRTWHKICLVNEDHSFKAYWPPEDEEDLPGDPSAEEVKVPINSFRNLVSKKASLEILKFELMIVK